MKSEEINWKFRLIILVSTTIRFWYDAPSLRYNGRPQLASEEPPPFMKGFSILFVSIIELDIKQVSRNMCKQLHFRGQPRCC